MSDGSFLLITSLSVLGGLANHYDPHVFPRTGPFMEGWYLRFQDRSNKRSFAVITGSVLPENPESGENLTFVGLLLGLPGRRLIHYSTFPPESTYNVTVNGGQAVTHDPDMTSPPNFDITVPSVGQISVRNNRSDIVLLVDNIHFKATIGPSVPWGPDGEGPEGWVQYFNRLLPLNWFVYSLGSPLQSYEWTDIESGERLTGEGGLVHMEKNWGNSFPTAWVWTQGFTDPQSGLAYALSYGPLSFGSLNVDGFLFGYRNTKKGLVVNFTPANSMMIRSDTDACSGTINISILGLWYKVELSVSGPLSSFSECLYCPYEEGFRPGSVETYQAHTTIVVYKRHLLFFHKEVDRQFVDDVGLEFGGNFLCGTQCNN